MKAADTGMTAAFGDHLMLMKPSAAVKLSSGDSVEFTAIAKPFAGAQETYDPGSRS
ncbi:hypothetical protein OHA21_49975 [Actinoplanes sp. NBC_00393]